jgi:hypothetical protein
MILHFLKLLMSMFRSIIYFLLSTLKQKGFMGFQDRAIAAKRNI